jgi:hypothetical protein
MAVAIILLFSSCIVTELVRHNGMVGRPPIGKRAMTNAERQRRYRQLHGANSGHSVPQKVGDMSTDNTKVAKLREAPPLPERIEEWERFIKAERTLNDLVEDVHRILVNENAKYRGYLRATYDAHAVEGSLAADNVLAAIMIREKAIEIGNTEVAAEKLAIINLALGVVLRRYHASRKQRRNRVGGEEVPNENGE